MKKTLFFYTLLCVFWLAVIPNGAAQTYMSNPSPNIAIPDNGCSLDTFAYDTITVPVGGDVIGTDVVIDKVCINITHTWDSDVYAYLIAPDSTIILLTGGNGGSGDDYINTCFSPDATNPLSTGAAPFTGTFMPDESFGPLNGLVVDGDWVLRVCDDGNGDTGTINQWSLKFSPPPACPNPSDLTATNITGVGADLSWTGSVSATSWELEIGAAGFTPADTATHTSATNPYTYADGAGQTSYDYYVRGICGVDSSEWRGPYTFMTAFSAPFCESWESTSYQGTGSSAPQGDFGNGWSSTATTDPDWTVSYQATTNSSGTGPVGPHDQDYYVYLETSGGAIGDTDTLTGPVVDMTALSTPALTFYYHMFGDQMGTLQWEASADGTTWAVLGSITGQQQTAEGDPWLEQYQDLAAYSTSLQLRFIGIGNGTFEGDMAIDYICVDEAPACPKPSDLAISNITSSTARLDWTASANSTAYIVEYGVSGFTLGSGTMDTIAASPYAFSNLLDDTEYQVYLVSDCAVDGLSDPVGPVTFTTEVLCEAVTDVTVTNITATTADISWAGPLNGVGYYIEYGLDGYTQGFGDTVTSATNSVTLSGLMANEIYDVYVLADCGMTDGVSLWSAVVGFTTLCETYTADYCEGFEGLTTSTFQTFTNGVYGNCWSSEFDGGPDWAVDAENTGSSNTGPLGAYEGTHYVYLENGGSLGDSDTLTGPNVDISGLTTPEFSFYYHMFGVDMGTLIWEVSQDAGATWTTLDSLVGQQQAATGDDWLQQTEDLSSLGATEVMVRFIGFRGPSFADDICLDDICIQEKPLCSEPVALGAINLTGTTADLFWSDGGDAIGYSVEYGEAGFTQGTGTIMGTVDTFLSVTGLNVGSAYEFYVQQTCTGGAKSNHAGPFAFNTTCDGIITAPYCQGFEGLTTSTSQSFANGDFGNCWESLVDGGPDWSVDGSNTGSTGTGPLGAYAGDHYTYLETSSGTAGQSDTLTGPEIDVSGLTAPYLSFYYHMFGADIATLQWEVSDDAGVTWTVLGSLVGQQQAATGDAWALQGVDLSSLTGTTVIVRFVGFRGSSFAGDISLDEICVGEEPPCKTATNLTVVSSTALEAIVSWVGGANAVNYIVEYGVTGFPLGQGDSISTTDTFATLTPLVELTGYEFYVTVDCGAIDGVSPGAGPKGFTTPCGAVLAPFCEGFESLASNTAFHGDFGNCWGSVTTADPDWTTEDSNTGSSNTGPTGPSVGSRYVYLETSSGNEGDFDVLTGPQIDLSALTEPQLAFDYHMFGADMGTLKWEVSEDAGATWITIDSLTGQQQAADSDAWITQTADLSGYTSPIVLRFIGVRGTGFTGDMALDEICVRETPPCQPAYDLAAVEILDTAATINWSGPTNAVTYVVEIGPDGFTPGTGDTTLTTDTFTTFDPLTIDTDYDVYITVDCDVDSFSVVAGPFSFRAENPPNCMLAVQPLDGATNVTINPTIEAMIDTSGPAGTVTQIFANAGTHPDSLDTFGPFGVSGSTIALNYTGLQFNTTYYWQFIALNGAGQSDSCAIWSFTTGAQAVNDECAGAIPLTVNSDLLCGTTTPGTIDFSTGSLDDPAACGGTEDDDVWYSFVATSTQHSIDLLNVANGTTDLYHSVWEGACGALTNLTCSDPNESSVGGLTVGNTYYLRVYSWTSTPGQTTTYDVCIGTPPPPPVNDECMDAIALTVNPDLNCGTVTNGTIEWATASSQDPAACGGTENDDVWYSFVATAESHTIDLLNVTNGTTDLYHSVWEGMCDSLVNLTCSDPNSSSVSGLTVGNTYHLRVYSWTSTSGQTSVFDVCIGTLPPPPFNDECSSAIPVPVNPDFSCAQVVAGTVTSATASTINTTACSGTENDDVWFSFVATDTIHTISLINVAGSTTDMYHSLWEGACDTSITNLLCSDPNSSTATNLTIGNTYILRVYTWSSSTGANVNFDVCIGTTPPPPANDSCANATPVIANSDLLCGNTASGSVGSATASPDDPAACGGTEDDDVWFSFVATSTFHDISLLNVFGSTTDMYHSVWEGTCGSLTNLLCSDADDSSITGLTIGNTYYLRVYTWTATAGQTSSFDVCIGTPPPPPANDLCDDAIRINCDDVLLGETTISATGGFSGSCLGSIGDDVWYSFGGTEDIVTITINGLNGFEPQIDVQESADGSCDPAQLTCVTNTYTGNSTTDVTITFISELDVVYYVNVGNWINGDPPGDFDLLVTCEPQCFAPTELAISGIAANEADFSWLDNGSSSTWTVEYGPAGFTPGTGTTVAGVTNPYTITGLTKVTDYEAYVSGDCGTPQAGLVAFTTGTCSNFLILSGTPPTGSYNSKTNIISTSTVNSGNTVVFNAGSGADHYIDLLEGFEVKLGADFQTKGVGCQ